jgi:Do/DeqQ family serine protease
MNSSNQSINPLKTFLLISLALGLGLGSGYVIGQSTLNFKPGTATEFSSVPKNKQISNLTNSYAPAVAKASPAVVNVFSEKTVKRNNVLDLFFENSFGEEDFYIPPQKLRQRSLGSGVLISADGYILTNSHVINGADKISVTMTDGREMKTKLVGLDSKTDLALLKIEGQNLPFVSFTDSEKIEIGDVVLAIGNPFGIGQTVTLGIISAKKRENLGILDYEEFLQTDAAINPGNSGGALIDAAGNLIGINTAIFSKSGGYQGIGFAVPANLAKKIAEELKAKGKITRSYLGVSVVDMEKVASPIASYFLQNGFEKGALIVKVQANGPADRAGLKEASLITKINGKSVSAPEELFKLIAQTPLNKPVDIEAQVLNEKTGHIKKEIYSVKPGVS